MQAKEFRYDTRSVFPDLQSYLFSRDDVYGTTTPLDYPHIVEGLISGVSVALKDPMFRLHMLNENIPDRVRVLLDGVGILTENEVDRRWGMLQSMYREYAKDWKAPIGVLSSGY